MSTDAKTQTSEEEKAFDFFELVVAILLGLAALGTAWAGFQSGQWGGKMQEAYGEANTIATKAATEHNAAFVAISQDSSVDIQAKKLIAEGRDAENEADRDRAFEIASYLYIYQLNIEAYDALGLPLKYREDASELEDPKPGEKKDDKSAAPAQTPAAGQTAEKKDEKKATVNQKLAAPPTKGDEDDVQLPEEELYQAYATDLEDEYYKDMLSVGDELFKKADARFDEGRKANEIGDQHDLNVVVYTVALFFAGIALVFKTKIRWGFFFAGSGVFIVATVKLFTTPWA